VGTSWGSQIGGYQFGAN